MPTPPPRDAAGAVIPHDHPDIHQDDIIIRRVTELHVVLDKGVRRLSSMLYNASEGLLGGMSVDVEKFIIEADLNPKQWVVSPKWIGAVYFNVGFLRDRHFQVGYDPIQAGNGLTANPYHGQVWGKFTGARKQICKRWLCGTSKLMG